MSRSARVVIPLLILVAIVLVAGRRIEGDDPRGNEFSARPISLPANSTSVEANAPVFGKPVSAILPAMLKDSEEVPVAAGVPELTDEQLRELLKRPYIRLFMPGTGSVVGGTCDLLQIPKEDRTGLAELFQTTFEKYKQHDLRSLEVVEVGRQRTSLLLHPYEEEGALILKAFERELFNILEERENAQMIVDLAKKDLRYYTGGFGAEERKFVMVPQESGTVAVTVTTGGKPTMSFRSTSMPPHLTHIASFPLGRR